MGYTQKLGLLAQSVFQDSSLNVGIGAAPSGSYKLEVTGTAKVSSTLLLGGALSGTSATFNSNVSIGGYLTGQGTNPGGLGGSRYVLDWNGGNTRIFSYGADASTNGAFLFSSQRSDGSNSVNVLSISANGVSTFSSSVQITGYVAPSSGAGLELFYYNNTASLFGYDRTNSVYKPMSFGTNNQLYLPINGYVGIGTGNPIYNLDVYSTASNSIIRAGAYAIMQNVATSQAMFGYNITYDTALGWKYINAAYATAIRMYGGDIVFHSAASSTAGASAPNWDSTDIKMTIKNGGNVGIGSSGYSDTRLNIQGAGATSATYAFSAIDSSATLLFAIRNDGYGYLKASAWAYGSDKRIKENINYIQTGLDKVLALKPATFDYIEGVKNNIGWIAQDVQEVIPEAVCTISDTNDQLTLKSDFIIPYLVKAIQEQQAMITSLQDRLDKAGL